MKIGDVSAATGLPAKTIRYYESVGLIEPPARSDGNYRIYDANRVATLRFVHHARTLGFSIEEVGALVALWRDKRRASADVRRLAAGHLDDIDTRITELRRMRHALQGLVDRCHGNERPECPILNELAEAKN
ncbi:MAG TPA: Cu(I)-responsive transcriptional regulator [Stellaceae bacterium]|nr:Cu(I)-responsive transcriptional regulator [Stellaceae bacterium]